MAIYAATIPGRKTRVLVRATSRTEAMARFVTVESLSADDMQDALDRGETVWRPDAEMPGEVSEVEAAPEKDLAAKGGD